MINTFHLEIILKAMKAAAHKHHLQIDRFKVTHLLAQNELVS